MAAIFVCITYSAPSAALGQYADRSEGMSLLSWIFLLKVLYWALGFIGVASFMALIISVVFFVIAGGGEEPLAKSAAFFSYAFLGILVYIIGYFLLRYLERLIDG